MTEQEKEYLQTLSTEELWDKHQELGNTWDGIKYPNKAIECQVDFISKLLQNR